VGSSTWLKPRGSFGPSEEIQTIVTLPGRSWRQRGQLSITVDPRLGEWLNPQTTTDAEGAFSVSVPKDLFKRFKAGELGLGVFNGTVSPFEPEIVKYDVKAATVEMGRLVFKPMHDPTK
jgi:hypothetical protein